MSNKTDLDWLARNVHVWPVSTPNIVPAGDKLFEFGATFHQDYVDIYGKFPGCGHSIYHHQWLARRAELQNKPSWNDAPVQATCMAQEPRGVWTFFACQPSSSSPVHDTWWRLDGFQAWSSHMRGEVLGDWRDTLEKRPEHDEFETLISIEGNQEQDMTQQQEMNQDNGWFERGELPPVGMVCLYVVSDRLSAEVEITAHAKLGLCFVQVGQSGESYVSKTAELHRFRPIRTERDVLIEIIKQWDGLVQTDDVLADAILAAGFKRG